jgi:hypothetical protein
MNTYQHTTLRDARAIARELRAKTATIPPAMRREKSMRAMLSGLFAGQLRMLSQSRAAMIAVDANVQSAIIDAAIKAYTPNEFSERAHKANAALLRAQEELRQTSAAILKAAGLTEEQARVEYSIADGATVIRLVSLIAPATMPRKTSVDATTTTRTIAKGYRVIATGARYSRAMDAVIAAGVDDRELSHAPDGTPYYAAYINADLKKANPKFEKIAG